MSQPEKEPRVYVTKHHEYVVQGRTEQGKEIITLPFVGNEGIRFFILGFYDEEKLHTIKYGNDRFWSDKETGQIIVRGPEHKGLEEKLSLKARPGLRIVAELIRELGDEDYAERIGDEVVTSPIVAIRN